ncbi:Anti-anti-sigma regulatory factor (antagonist of anti-sigma factor) [Alkalicoccus daliensis]|uniref:Anti-anti-sigma regulatory factor (Antagonist of anti-sigma factor) n=1 Tax=Alkalicoccus daliensis TaxID=745820 RepID=A0A1H0J4N6_9BACI|nr:Anti-anti-sigma regulatory factor (antagonist of anti-sigma factor) [Alkalicoccus daliensis]
MTKDLPVTEELGGGTLLGVPIMIQGDKHYGTLCAYEDKPREFTKNEIDLFDVMGRLFGYVVEVDIEKEQVENAVVPIVTIGEGVVILPLTGIINEERAQVILDQVLEFCATEATDYVILDISGLVQDEEAMTEKLVHLMTSLNLVGATAIITGVRPDQARTLHKQNLTSYEINIKTSVQDALRWIG